MTILTIDKKAFEKDVGKVTKEVEDAVTMMGAPVEEVTNDEFSVEIFPNRPDLLSRQGLVRNYLQYVEKKGVASYNVGKPDKNYVVEIDKSVKGVRQHTACAIVRGLKLNEARIKDIIDMQEKLHLTIGRRRKKLAIGVYPLDKIKLPIKFEARKPSEIKFVPLESPGGREMTGAQILRGHPTGRDYADLLKDFDRYPVFVDAENNILSMPPIINSEMTGRVDEKTRDVFVECSGSNLAYLKKCLNILVTALAEMGGKIYAMNIKDSKSGDFVSPDLSSEKVPFNVKDINKNLGLDLGEKEIKKYLKRMGIGVESSKKGLVALVPAYRADVLHWIDLAEDVAIAYGYQNFQEELPEIASVAEESSRDKTRKLIGRILSGLGLLEISSYHIAPKKDIKKLRFDYKDFLGVEESKTENDTLRIDLMTSLLRVFSENSDSQYPQKIFEVGKVFEKDEKSETCVLEKERLAVGFCDENVNFTDVMQALDYLFRMLDVEYRIENAKDNSNYIAGRCGKVIVKTGEGEKEIGLIGELAPRVMRNWKIGFPVSAFEIELDWLLG